MSQLGHEDPPPASSRPQSSVQQTARPNTAPLMPQAGVSSAAQAASAASNEHASREFENLFFPIFNIRIRIILYAHLNIDKLRSEQKKANIFRTHYIRGFFGIVISRSDSPYVRPCMYFGRHLIYCTVLVL